MLKFYSRKWMMGIISLLFISQISYAQSKITGIVTDAATKEPLVGVSVSVKGKVIGTITDTKGGFSLSTTTQPPFDLLITSIGYSTQEVAIKSGASVINVALKEESILGQEVVVAASRVEETALQSPVTVEKMDIRGVRETPSPSFYDAIKNLKGVASSQQSLTFNSINVRGFGANANNRFVQLMDGMDNSAPGLNFPMGNIVGISELDLESAELLPGASSALYGPNAMNGILLMNSKSPFTYQGLSAYAKTGMMNASNRVNTDGSAMGSTPFYDVGARYAKAINNRLAFKAGFSYLQAQDWQANDNRDMSFPKNADGTYTNLLSTGTRTNNQNYNGINVYGDENSTNFNLTQLQPALTSLMGVPLSALPAAIQPLIGGISQLSKATGIPTSQIISTILPSTLISRTGYSERDLVDYKTSSLKLNGALHYRFTDKLEGIAQINWGTGSTIYTGNDRYAIKDFVIWQAKAELKGSNFFLRAYTTQENSGKAYAVGTLGSLINEVAKPSYDGTNLSTLASSWFPQYGLTYAGGNLQALTNALLSGQSYATAIATMNSSANAIGNAARNAADAGRLVPGSAAFNAVADKLKSLPLYDQATQKTTGALFTDKTTMYHVEGMYNLKEITFADVLVGANYRVYNLNSNGTLFALDANGKEFSIHQWGAYVQASKQISNFLKLSASMRYDKCDNFEGQTSPRISAVISPSKTSSFRLSYQTAFRIPSTQDQYIDLITPQAHLIGVAPYLLQKYGLTDPTKGTVYTLDSKGGLTPYTFPTFKPETVASFEVGYKTVINNKLILDAYYYYSTFKNFSGTRVLVRAKPDGTSEVFGLQAANYTNDINSKGIGISADWSLPRNFMIGGNISINSLGSGLFDGLFSSDLNQNTLSDGFGVGYNTPKKAWSLTLGNRNIAKSGYAVNVVLRGQDQFSWQSTFVSNNGSLTNQTVVPSYTTLDAQVSKKIPSIKSIIKIGGTNLTGNTYQTNFGNPMIGSIYYIAISFDELLNR